MTSQTTSREMELWLDLRRVAARTTAGDGALATIAPSRLDLVDAVLVDCGDDRTLPTWTERRYAVRSDPDGGRDQHDPPRLFRRGDDDRPVGAVVDASTPSGQDAALGLVGSVEWIVLTCRDRETGEGGEDGGWIMIPAENLVSSCQNTGTRIAAVVDRAGDVGGLARALELGIDALCVDAADALENEELWDALIDAKEERRAAADTAGADDETNGSDGPVIVQGTCKRVVPAGGKGAVLADRVCIDMVRTLEPTEGCWIGSSAKVTALVLSEAARSSFVPSRPFRVNAGPVHSYVVMGDGASTKYLSELVAGDEVLVYDAASGRERPVAVGRLKVEVRPCVQVEMVATQTGEGGAGRGQVFLQQAETVRLGQALGSDSFLRVTDLECGENALASDVLLRVAGLGTHVGKAYSGKVTER